MSYIQSKSFIKNLDWTQFSTSPPWSRPNSYLSEANRFVQYKWILDFPDFFGQKFFLAKGSFWPKKYFFGGVMVSTNWREKQPQKARIWNQKLALSVCLRVLFQICITAVGQAVKFDWIDLFPEVFPSKENDSRASQATLMIFSEMNKSSTFVFRNWHWCPQHKTDAVGQLFDLLSFSPPWGEAMMKNAGKLWRIAKLRNGMKCLQNREEVRKEKSPLVLTIHWQPRKSSIKPILMGWFSPTQALWELM